MEIEPSSNKTVPIIVGAIARFAFPLYTHKRESDRANKHTEWSKRQHIVLTTLAIFADAGFDLATATLFLSEHFWSAAFLKPIHILGSEILPQKVTDFKNRLSK